MARPRVVVVGAGFGGLWAARGLAKQPVDVTLLDRRNYHTFFPLLYQVAAAELVPTDIAYPIRSIFRRADNVTVRLAEMCGLDLEGKRVITDHEPIPYDFLVMALGSEPNFFGLEGAGEHAFPLRWMDDAIPLRHHVLGRFEAAASAPADRRVQSLTFVVVGGGPTGVEYAGALSELISGPLLRDFPGLSQEDVRVVLVEAGQDLLAGMPEELRRYALDRLHRRRVSVRCGTTVESVAQDHVRLAGGEVIETGTVVWTAGIQGDPRVREWGLPVGRGGRVPVGERLQVDGYPDVFVIGDLAYSEDPEGRPLPQVAQVALQQGRYTAGVIGATVSGRDVQPFRYKDPGMLAVIGRNAAVASVFGGAFKGLTAWLLWLGIHITWLIGFRNRVLVLVNWAWNYVFFHRAVRLILPSLEGDGAPSAGRRRRETLEDVGR